MARVRVEDLEQYRLFLEGAESILRSQGFKSLSTGFFVKYSKSGHADTKSTDAQEKPAADLSAQIMYSRAGHTLNGVGVLVKTTNDSPVAALFRIEDDVQESLDRLTEILAQKDLISHPSLSFFLLTDQSLTSL
jgi:hypothetical protein